MFSPKITGSPSPFHSVGFTDEIYSKAEKAEATHALSVSENVPTTLLSPERVLQLTSSETSEVNAKIENEENPSNLSTSSNPAKASFPSNELTLSIRLTLSLSPEISGGYTIVNAEVKKKEETKEKIQILSIPGGKMPETTEKVKQTFGGWLYSVLARKETALVLTAIGVVTLISRAPTSFYDRIFERISFFYSGNRATYASL